MLDHLPKSEDYAILCGQKPKMEKYSSAKLGTVNFKKSKFVCRGCNRTLDDCVFVDESTKLFTPYCKTCRSVMNVESRYWRVHLHVENDQNRFQETSIGVPSDGSLPKSEKIPNTTAAATSASIPSSASTSASVTPTPTSTPPLTTSQNGVFKVFSYPKFPTIPISIVHGVIPCSNWTLVPSSQLASPPFRAKLLHHRSYTGGEYL